jgi:hypothetical protein
MANYAAFSAIITSRRLHSTTTTNLSLHLKATLCECGCLVASSLQLYGTQTPSHSHSPVVVNMPATFHASNNKFPFQISCFAFHVAKIDVSGGHECERRWSRRKQQLHYQCSSSMNNLIVSRTSFHRLLLLWSCCACHLILQNGF